MTIIVYPMGKVRVKKYIANDTWYRPQNVNSVRIIAVGGGQGGNGVKASTTSRLAAGGGAGGSVVDQYIEVTSDLTLTIGAGGAGGTAPGTKDTFSAGSEGGNTTITGTGVSLTAYGGGKRNTSGSDDTVAGKVGNAGGGGGAGWCPPLTSQYVLAPTMPTASGGGNQGTKPSGGFALSLTEAGGCGGPGLYGLGGGGGAGHADDIPVVHYGADGGGAGAAVNNTSAAGGNATDGTGGGGGGAASDFVTTGRAGGDGGDGCVIVIWEE